MKRSTARWTTSLAAAALLCLPVAGQAQTPTTAQPPASTSQAPATDTQNVNADEHLRQAKSALNAIAPTAVTGRAKSQLADLKRHIDALERASGTTGSASATGDANRSSRSTAARGKVNWSTEVAQIDKILNSLLGPASTTGSTSDPTSATGTSGTTSSARGAATLDEATRTQLESVRTHITAYAAAMSGTASSAPSTSSDPAATAGATAGSTTGSTAGSTTGSATGSTTGSMTGTTGSTTGTSGTMTGSAAGSASTPVDQEAARRHLTEARETLSQLTQLPAAAQLSGEARTQVSQLISNFNELITTQAEWRASYSKLEANLDALIGPDNTDAERTGGVSTGTTGTTGTTGATGTSGTAGTSGSASVNLDPAIRAKLVEFRAKLNEFERAAGGATAGGAASASDSTTGTTGSTSGTAAGSMTGTTSGTTGSTQATTPQTGAHAQHAEAAGHSEAMKHIAQMEAILEGRSTASTGTTSGTAGTTSGTTGTASGTAGTTSGTTASPSTTGVTSLSKAQIDQLRTHLTELKRLLSQAGR